MVEVHLDGYLPAFQEIDVEAGRAARIELSMDVDPNAAAEGDGEAPDQRRRVLTLGVGIGLGFSLQVFNTFYPSGLAHVDFFLGGRFGTARNRRGLTFWPLRVEGFLFVAGILPAENVTLALVEFGLGGRISLAPLEIPLRFEVEGALGYGYGTEESNAHNHFLGFAKFTVVYQLRRWLEVGACPLRFDFVGRIRESGWTFLVRYGLEAVVRFRY
jgi:hypothetical protein